MRSRFAIAIMHLLRGARCGGSRKAHYNWDRFRVVRDEACVTEIVRDCGDGANGWPSPCKDGERECGTPYPLSFSPAGVFTM